MSKSDEQAFRQIWPMGHGVVIQAVGEAEYAGMLFFVGVANDLVREPGAEAGYDDFMRLVRNNAPSMMLHFKDINAVDALIWKLGEVKDAIMAARATATERT